MVYKWYVNNSIKIFFETESPDWNDMIEKGNLARLAANRVLLSIMSEFGICNDRRMTASEFSIFISNAQLIGIVK